MMRGSTVGRSGMPLYRCYFLDENEHVLAPPDVIDAPHDQAAIEQARAAYESHTGCALVGVWAGDRRVARFTPP